MIRSVVIDDEQSARNILSSICKEHFHEAISMVGEADDVESGLELIVKHKPDLVFLDVKMPQGSGFDLLERLDRLDFEVIFITAYDQFALKAFQFSAFGYLLKPIKIQEIRLVIDRLKASDKGSKSDVDSRLKVLIENQGEEDTKKLVIRNQLGFQIAKLKNIIRLEGDGNYTHFIIDDQPKVTTSKSLGEYEDLLYDHGFFRIHQSTIVNLSHVKAYQDRGRSSVKMSDGQDLNVSRHRKVQFLKRFE